MNEYEIQRHHERLVEEKVRHYLPGVVALVFSLIFVGILFILHDNVKGVWITSAIFAGILVGVAALIRPEWALLALTILAPLPYLTNYTLIPGTGITPVNAVALLLIASTLAQVFSINQPAVEATGVDKWLWRYMGWSFFSIFVGIMMWSLDVSGIGEWVSMFCGYSLYWVVRRRFRSEKLSVLGVAIVLIMVAIESVWVMYDWRHQDTTHFSFDLKEAIAGTFPQGNSNDVATYLSAYAMVALGLFMGKKVGAWRLPALAVFLLASAATFCTYSRAAYYALMIGVMVVVLYKHRRYALPAALAIILLPSFLPGSIAMRLNQKGDASAETRKDLWKHGMSLMFWNPVGIGWRGYEKDAIERHQELRDPHNMYVLVGAEQGIVGFVLFLGLLAVSGREIIRAVHRARTPFAQALGVGLFGALIAMCVDSMFGTRMIWFYSMEHFWFLLGVLMLLSKAPPGGPEVLVEQPAQKELAAVSPWRYKSYV